MKLEASVKKKTIICWDAKDTCKTPDQQSVYLSREADQDFLQGYLLPPTAHP